MRKRKPVPLGRLSDWYWCVVKDGMVIVGRRKAT